MKSKLKLGYITLLIVILICPILYGTSPGAFKNNSKKNLSISFDGDAKIEVGSHFVGVEFHHSYPVPQRFSFYYPVANSIDLSTDYWRRDTTFAMDIGLKFSDQEVEWLSKQSLPFELTPFSVQFNKRDQEKAIDISYRFTKNKPAVVINYIITNKSDSAKEIEFYTNHALSFRTSHTFKLKDEIQAEVTEKGNVVYVDYNDYETQNAQLFILNVGEKPTDWQVSDLDKKNKNNYEAQFANRKLIFGPTANFLYKKKLKPNEKLVITQIVGTCKQSERREIVRYLKENYTKETVAFESSVLSKINDNGTFKTGDKYLDRSVLWAKTILEVNKHYIDGEIVPMPCPAEYNFYFTHDVLLTDLAAVKFDLERVKKDLKFIIKLANKDKIIPHAYYWKDSSFVTEFADHDNWNNLWFIIVASEYLKYSGDKKFVSQLFPYIEKSLTQSMLTKGDDDLMWSYRPDWWDIGRRYGQRSYMTILAIKSIRSFLYLSSTLDKDPQKLIQLEQLSEQMKKNLSTKLWLDEYKYLMNYSGTGKIDEHYYCGSLLSAHYSLLDSSKISKLVTTAKQKIMDPKLGVYTVFPMDFDQLQDYWHFVNNEAGDQFYYINGGIWTHSNAWYALALMADKKKEEASRFIKDVMTIDGIMNRPNGQPAMYEVRNGNYNAPKIYGTVDKPQFMWAAGWYLYSIYHLFGLSDNDWNISFDPFLLKEQKECSFDLNVNGNLAAVKLGKSKFGQINIDGKEMYSFIIPQTLRRANKIDIGLGVLRNSYLKNTNSVLNKCDFDKNKNEMIIYLEAFKGHQNETVIISNQMPDEVFLNGNKIENVTVQKTKSEYQIKVDFTHQNKIDQLIIKF